MLACDINDRHEYYETWVAQDIREKFYGLFLQMAFETLFFRYSKFTAPKTKGGKFEMAEVVMTHGETPAHVLYQSIGPEAIDKLPGFFGNFYIVAGNINKELEAYKKLISKYDWKNLVDNGAKLYNAPCNNKDDREIVKEVLHSLPKALKYANEKKCGLLGLAVTVG